MTKTSTGVVDRSETPAIDTSPGAPQPATIAEAEALLAQLERELHFELPVEEHKLKIDRERALSPRGYDPARADALKAEIFRLGARNNELILSRIPEAQNWLVRLRRERSEAAERAQEASLINGRDIGDVVGEVAGKVEALEAEWAQLPVLIRQAATQGDAERLIELRQRHAALPGELLATQILLARVQVAQLLGQAEQAHAQQAQAWTEVEKAEAALKAAQATARTARGHHGDLVAEEQMARQAAAQRRRWIQDQVPLLAKERG